MKKILIITLTIFVFTSLLNTSLVKIAFAQQRGPEPPPPGGPKGPVPQLQECKKDEVFKDGKCVPITKQRDPGQKQRKPEPPPPGGPKGPVPQLQECKKDEVFIDGKCVPIITQRRPEPPPPRGPKGPVPEL